MDNKVEDRYFLQLALEEGEKSERQGGIPIGAVIVGPNGKLIQKGRNRVYSDLDATAHAEIDVIRKCGEPLIKKGKARDYTLYTTVEPCVMCSGAIYLSNIARVVWALNDDLFGGFRQLSKHHKYEQRFEMITTTAMPFNDLANIQRDRMVRWDQLRGKNDRWPEIDKVR
ncbi:nucleoside deaminase [Pseudalkalibacillus berkeleyi]|uniref:Nucleoside deaminase n=1 Tax=Pseudalkalibacillus berkeleyi TaxID=1069813 RepID=A0ABS9GYF3_9BACL|nr:nucleoside deaminase [Pseudalkalibacillus berkeleyi]MCF6136701.1 nucleoside deaminase [Pseudalkalibacillus berkeleyi]